MFDKRGKLAMSNGKWPRVRLAVVVTSTLLVLISIPYPVAAFIPSVIRHVQPTAEFMFTVWSWITPSCVYVLLNILILALGLQSGALTASHARPSAVFVKAEAEANWKSDADANADDDFEHTHEFEIQTHTNISIINAACENVSMPDDMSESKPTECGDLMKDFKAIAGETKEESSKMKEVDHLQAKPSGGLYCKKSRRSLMRRSTTGLSNLSRETTHAHTKLNPHLDSVRESVVFEICAEVDDHAEENQNQKVLRHEVNLSSEELYAKAESFIGDFYRELKMQRENSWKRLCNIYKQSS